MRAARLCNVTSDDYVNCVGLHSAHLLVSFGGGVVPPLCTYARYLSMTPACVVHVQRQLHSGRTAVFTVLQQGANIFWPILSCHYTITVK